ncbi:MAG: HPF/RaiA family ribosome-associated protein [Candidatus Krumholzibacteriia bacterium]
MNLELKTRHFQLDDEMEEKIAATFEKLERFSPRPISEVRLLINHENNLFHCDGVLFLKGQEFRAENTGAEPDLAAAGVAEVLQRQLEKYKGKISGKHRGEAGGLGAAQDEVAPTVHFATEHFEMLNLNAARARDAFTDSDAPFLVYRDTDTGRVSVVYRRKDGDLGIMEARNS